MITALDLFSGIGGFSLALEKVGVRTVAFCEIDPFCRKVLKKHWPRVPVHHDITQLKGDQVGYVDIICGGFHCQDISLAGRRAGLEGARSGLWGEYARLVGELGPRFVIVENVAALRSKGLDKVLADLAALGYDAIWDCMPASAVGAPHRRDRIWIVAYSARAICPQLGAITQGQQDRSADDGHASNAAGQRQSPARIGELDQAPSRARQADWAGGLCEVLFDASGSGLASRLPVALGPIAFPERSGWRNAEPRLGRMADGISPWAHEPDDVPRIAKGIPDRVRRLKALGNAVVPQVVEIVARAVMQSFHIEDAIYED